MAATRNTTDDHSWETQDTPHVSRRTVWIATIVYTIWLGFLAVMAAQRWISLQ